MESKGKRENQREGKDVRARDNRRCTNKWKGEEGVGEGKQQIKSIKMR